MEKKQITARIGQAGAKWLEDTATATGATQAVVMRAALAVAAAHPHEVTVKVAAMLEGM